MIKKIFFMALITVYSSFAFALSDSPPIPFDIGDVKPGVSVKFLLSTIPNINPQEYYSVTCHIYNPNYNKQYPIVLGMYSQATNLTLNGKALNSGQAALTQQDNFYATWPIAGSSNYAFNLSFDNFDNSDTATIANCVATPIS